MSFYENTPSLNSLFLSVLFIYFIPTKQLLKQINTAQTCFIFVTKKKKQTDENVFYFCPFYFIKKAIGTLFFLETINKKTKK